MKIVIIVQSAKELLRRLHQGNLRRVNLLGKANK